MELADLTAAPSVLKLGKKTYRLSPLRDRDFGEFERWAQDRYMDVALRNLGTVPENERKTLINIAYATASEITLSSPEALKLMTTVEGSVQLLWLSLRHEQPEISLEEAASIASDSRTLAFCMDRIQKLNQMQEKADSTVKKKTAKAEAKPSTAKNSIGAWLKHIISPSPKSQT